MKSIILITSVDSGSWPYDTVNVLGKAHWTDPARKVVESGSRWLAITHDNDVQLDYEADNLRKVNALISNPSFFLIESNEYECFKKLIVSINVEIYSLVDNDHGWIGSLQEYKRAISIGKDWLRAKHNPITAAEPGATG